MTSIAPTTVLASRAPFPLVRLGIGLCLANFLWTAPYVGGISTLLPAKLDQVAPAAKVGLLGTTSLISALLALFGGIVLGYLSDRTRTRLGKRIPWMIAGSLLAAAAMLSLGHASTGIAVVALWCAFQLAAGAIVAPLIAVIPDRIPTEQQGTFSAVFGVGTVCGAGLGNIIAAQFVTNPTAGTTLMAALLLFAGPALLLFSPERDNRSDALPAPTGNPILNAFSFPRHGARDFYLALVGKLLFVLAFYCVASFMLFIVTDHYGVAPAEAGGILALVALIQMLGSLIAGSIAGPVSDKLGLRKAPVVLSALIMAGALGYLVLATDPSALIVFAAVGMGLAFGIFNSVDQALNFELLPRPGEAAKDLGILGLANSGGQMLSPLIMALALTSFGNYNAAFAIAAGLAIASAVLIGLIRSVK